VCPVFCAQDFIQQTVGERPVYSKAFAERQEDLFEKIINGGFQE